MLLHQRLLGFDIRLDIQDYPESLWTAENRGAYLLRPEVRWPLSVDTFIWPSVFRYSTLDTGSSEIEQRRIRADTQMAGDGFWFDLNGMTSHFHQQGALKGSPRGIPIAIVLHVAQEITVNQFGSDVLQRRVSPSELPSGSVLLGYDVADAGQISGLSDCGYDAAEVAPLRSRWAARLNDFGLFATTEDAILFRDLSDNRVAEHAPFYVYGLYRLR
jgi:hypothetical protein